MSHASNALLVIVEQPVALLSKMALRMAMLPSSTLLPMTDDGASLELVLLFLLLFLLLLLVLLLLLA
jgi:hypothetical protein